MRILVIGASGGIGAAMAAHARALGASVTGLSRSGDGFDVTDEASVAGYLAALSGEYDRIVVATGGLDVDGHRPEKSLRALSAEALMAQFALNAVGPALVLKHSARLLPRSRPAVFAALSARVGSIGDNRAGGWYGYRAAKAALNQMIHTGAIELARTHPQLTCAVLHPGTVQTPLTAAYAARHTTIPADAAADNLWRVIDGFTPADTGRFFDWAGKPVPW